MISPELLRRYPFFGGLSEEQLKRIAMISEEINLEKDEFLFKEGEAAEAIYVIVDGGVDVLINIDAEGAAQEELSSLSAGEVLAWSAIVPPHTLTASAVANTPTRVVAVNAEAMRNLFEQDCELGYRILSRLVVVLRERLASTRTQLASLMAC